MPAKRLPWYKVWAEHLDHPKVCELTDAEYRTWHYLIAKASQQPVRWYFASVGHASKVTGRPLRQVQALLKYGLLEAGQTEMTEGIWVHNAKKWQEKYASDYTELRKGGNGPGVSASQWAEICNLYDNCCLACGSREAGITIDHIIPVSQGGEDDPGNVQPLCQSCNASKGTRTVDYRPNAPGTLVQRSVNARPFPISDTERDTEAEKESPRPIRSRESGVAASDRPVKVEFREDDAVAYAIDKGFAGNYAQRMVVKFLDHHAAGGWKRTGGVVIKDRMAAWRTWVGNELERNPVSGNRTQRNRDGMSPPLEEWRPEQHAV